MSNTCTNEVKLTKLEDTVGGLFKEMIVLVGSNAKMESSITSLSDAMQIIARKEATVEHHSEQIEILHKRCTRVEDEVREVESSIHSACDTRSKEADAGDRRVSGKVDETAKELDAKGVKRLALALAILATVFGYMYSDMATYKEATTKINEKIITKLDGIAETLHDVESDVKINKNNIKHTKENIDNYHPKRGQ